MSRNQSPKAEQVVYYRLDEVCAIANARDSFIVELIEYGVLEPLGEAPESWRFSLEQVRLCKRACNLRRDLGIDIPGIGLSLQLMSEIDLLRKQLALLKQVLDR